MKGAKRDIDEGEPEVIGDGEYHRFGQDGPQRRNGLVCVVWAVPFHSLNGGGGLDFLAKSRTSHLTSSKNSHVKKKEKVQTIAENRHGRRYGYSSQNQFPNKVGNLSCGRDSDPPAKGLLRIGEGRARCRRRVAYPIVTPTAQMRGMSPDAWALFVESVSSPIMLLTTPMFPLSKPAMQRLSEGLAMVGSGRDSSSTSLRGRRRSWKDRN
jgi:hypothetical protein